MTELVAVHLLVHADGVRLQRADARVGVFGHGQGGSGKRLDEQALCRQQHDERGGANVPVCVNEACSHR